MLQHKHLYFIKSSLKFVYSRKQSQYLYLTQHVSHFLLPCSNLPLMLYSPSERVLTRFDNEVFTNLALSKKSNMLDIFFAISSPFLSIHEDPFSIGKVMYFSVFSPKQVNCFLSFAANSFIIK